MKNIFAIICVLLSMFTISESYAKMYDSNDLDNYLAQGPAELETANVGVVSVTERRDEKIGAGGQWLMFFDENIAEALLEKHFGDYNLDDASAKYDELASAKDGYLSAQDFYWICKAGWIAPGWQRIAEGIKYLVFGVNDNSDLWTRCKDTFAKEMIEHVRIIQDIVYKTAIVDYNTFNQQCTPPLTYAATKDVRDIYCSAHKHDNDDPAFEKAWVTRLRIEGATCRNLNDGQNLTCFGIGAKGHPLVDEKEDFSIWDAYDIAYNDYYKNWNFQKLPDSLRGDFFMIAFHSGNALGTTKRVKRIVGMNADNGQVNDELVEKIKNYTGHDLRHQIYVKYWEWLQTTTNASKYRDGWAKALMLTMENSCHSPTPEDRALEENDKTKKVCSVTKKDFVK